MSNIFIARLIASIIFLPAVGIFSVTAYNYFGIVSGTSTAIYLWWASMFLVAWGIFCYKTKEIWG